MFNFRIINTEDGNQVIDRSLKTPYDALTPEGMVEYIEMDKQLMLMDRMQKKKQRETERKQKFTYRFMHKVACACGIM